ncbi:MAG: Cys-tRNA(Pro) deacylase [Desulfovibrionales bacterium]|mgnify:CR=1 FL=1|nr:Cys-tRNA(Pro) deacylase [Desulfovibrionales bacterium]
MTPAICVASKAGIAFTVHEFAHDQSHDSYGLEAAAKLNVPADRIFKTLIVDVGSVLAVGIIPVTAMLNMKSMARVLGAKKAAMADKADVERSTGYVLGGVSPLGQKKQLRTIIDVAALGHPTIFVSAGRRGLEIELCPHDLERITGAEFADIRQ